MTLHFVQLVLGNKKFKDHVSTDSCSYIADFRTSIKNKYPNLLISHDGALTLFPPIGSTAIDPGEVIEKLDEFSVGPWSPLVVTVEDATKTSHIGSFKKQLTYKGMSTEASCRKCFDALAAKFALFYKFDWCG